MKSVTGGLILRPSSCSRLASGGFSNLRLAEHDMVRQFGSTSFGRLVDAYQGSD
jgi:hypothetical protein